MMGRGKENSGHPHPYPLPSREREMWCDFEHSNFEFVSDFDIRISDLNLRRSYGSKLLSIGL
jgi:hypothetical protein